MTPAGASAATVAVEFSGVGFSYHPRRGSRVEAVAGLDFVAPAGSTTAIVGPNGCGKTTILRLACGMIEPDSGAISAQPAALMPQSDLLLPWAGALDNAALALRAAGIDRKSARRSAEEWFPKLGLEGFEDARPHELSGGMRQRVAFARTVLSGRPVLALDEPFASLDSLSRLKARDWLRSAIAETGRTALLVTHDIEEAIAVADRVVVLSPRPARVVAIHSTPRSGPDSIEAANLRREIVGNLLEESG